MAESFVDPFRRDYASRMNLSAAPTVPARLAAAFEHFSEVHPHSILKMRPPRPSGGNGLSRCAAPNSNNQLYITNRSRPVML